MRDSSTSMTIMSPSERSFSSGPKSFTKILSLCTMFSLQNVQLNRFLRSGTFAKSQSTKARGRMVQAMSSQQLVKSLKLESIGLNMNFIKIYITIMFGNGYYFEYVLILDGQLAYADVLQVKWIPRHVYHPNYHVHDLCHHCVLLYTKRGRIQLGDRDNTLNILRVAILIEIIIAFGVQNTHILCQLSFVDEPDTLI